MNTDLKYWLYPWKRDCNHLSPSLRTLRLWACNHAAIRACLRCACRHATMRRYERACAAPVGMQPCGDTSVPALRLWACNHAAMWAWLRAPPLGATPRHRTVALGHSSAGLRAVSTRRAVLSVHVVRWNDKFILFPILIPINSSSSSFVIWNLNVIIQTLVLIFVYMSIIQWLRI